MRVLVTGATRGIGRAIAAALRADGHDVIGTYRSTAADLPEGVHGVQCDVASTESVNAAYARIWADYGPVTAVVANAGITQDTLLMRMSVESFEDVLNTNLTGAVRVVQPALEHMAEAKEGRIVLVGSASGLSGMPGQANYTSSKSALVGYARAIARELGPEGITANVVAPGFTVSDMTDTAVSDAVKEIALKAIPAARFGTTEEIAGAVSYLLGPYAGYVNGVVLNVDGGVGMGH
ncbi:SDR family oxidoreductase [Tsukamurella ocularis]|uniref:SDR family oxidoreductase n=1 Tax=Tsukamurella ocularis TaxID=1970234 RepID=UPI002169F4E4|nr:SDR family oxidoreductase [Tsukamurella ocularis]MCS3779402.1 beta-ketoacyl ACP reductase [Tsukamurella ocularis]MCS3789868.1 beta-ketoacyl ACP reductase [Tsukamurella ocularis]